MLKAYFLSQVRYSAWASGRLLAALQVLPDVTLDAAADSSFSSLRKTAQHLYAAEDIWLQRLQLVEYPIWRGEDLHADFGTLAAAWRSTSAALIAFVEKQYDDRAFSHVVQYRSQKKGLFKTPVADILLHVCTHATYHRGQLVTLLRQAGVTKIPATDYIGWQRTGGK